MPKASEEANLVSVNRKTASGVPVRTAEDIFFTFAEGILNCNGFTIPEYANLKCILIPAMHAIRAMTRTMEKQISLEGTRPFERNKIFKLRDPKDERKGFICFPFTVKRSTPPSERGQILCDFEKMKAIMRKMRQVH